MTITRPVELKLFLFRDTKFFSSRPATVPSFHPQSLMSNVLAAGSAISFRR
jgi:hypothetical protein